MIYESEQVDRLDKIDREDQSMKANPSDQLIEAIKALIEGILPDSPINSLALIKTATYVASWIDSGMVSLDEAKEHQDTIYTVYSAYEFDLNG